MRKSPDPMEVVKSKTLYNGCWEYQGKPNKDGYCQLHIHKDYVIDNQWPLVHRYTYQRMGLTIPEGYTIDHLCQNRRCWNPDHLEAVTHSENCRRANWRKKLAMDEGALLDYMGDRAERWAAEFCRIAREKGHDIDEGWMVTWFANAIEHSYHVRKSRPFHRSSDAVL